jgi:hypothetical protein
MGPLFIIIHTTIALINKRFPVTPQLLEGRLYDLVVNKVF